MNIFNVTTPFQLFVTRKIVTQYCSLDRNLIVSSIKKDDLKNCKDVYQINCDALSMIKMWKLKRIIKKNIIDISFFVPHLGTLMGSYFFELAKKHNRPINVYYEGIALYYNPFVPNKNAKKKRLFMGVLWGIRYKHHEQLFPDDFVKHVNYCFAPKKTGLEKYKEVKLVELGSLIHNNSENVLILTSCTIKDSVIDDLFERTKEFIKDDVTQKIYVKPHYNMPTDQIKKVIESLRGLGCEEIVLLKKDTPIEEFYDSISFGSIISQAFSSALTNVSLIFGDSVKIFVCEKETIPVDIARNFNLKIE